MKKLFGLLLGVMFACNAFGQDIVTLMSGERFEANVTEVSAQSVKYRLLGQDSTIYVKPAEEILRIDYSNGKYDILHGRRATIQEQTSVSKEQTTAPKEQFSVAQSISTSNYDDFYRQANETRLRRLNVWTKITRIWGIVNIGVGALVYIAGNDLDYDPDYYFDYTEYEDARSVIKAMGVTSMVCGVATLGTSFVLGAKRNSLAREHNMVQSSPIFTKEYKLEHCTLAPSVNLMSYRNNPADGLGAGLTISF